MPGVNDTIVETVAIDNVKTIGESGSFYSAQAFRNAEAHSTRLGILAESALGSMLTKMNEMDPAQAASALKMLSGNEVATGLSQLLAALNSGQQGTKSAQTTPPVTP